MIKPAIALLGLLAAAPVLHAQEIQGAFNISTLYDDRYAADGYGPFYEDTTVVFSGVDANHDGILSLNEVTAFTGVAIGNYLNRDVSPPQTPYISPLNFAFTFVGTQPSDAWTGQLSSFSYNVSTQALSFAGNDFNYGASVGIQIATGSGVIYNTRDSYQDYVWTPGTTITPVPEPASPALLGLGLAGLALVRRRR